MEKTRQELINECSTLEELQALGEKFGYRPNWANHVWTARQDKKPGEDQP